MKEFMHVQNLPEMKSNINLIGDTEKNIYFHVNINVNYLFLLTLEYL